MQELPRHIAIIPDGNRRWAETWNESCREGHIRGVKRLREISAAAFEMGITYFTFWATSEDNLTKRSPAEIEFLTSLFCEELESGHALKECFKREVRVTVAGRWKEILKNERLNKRLSRAVASIERATMLFKKHRLTLLFGYSGKQEMLQTIRDLCDYMLDGAISPSPEDISEWLVNEYIGEGLPPVDLIIRTGACEEGPNWSHNSSGFMMWLAADAKVFSPPTLWPDFTVEMFRQTIVDYSKISRRLGA